MMVLVIHSTKTFYVPKSLDRYFLTHKLYEPIFLKKKLNFECSSLLFLSYKQEYRQYFFQKYSNILEFTFSQILPTFQEKNNMLVKYNMLISFRRNCEKTVFLGIKHNKILKS